MLTKESAFRAKDLMGLITHKLTAQPPLLTDLRKDVPIEIEELVCRMLAVDIELRPQRAGEVAELFNKIINRANESTSGSAQPKIFISYAREDETKARAVYRFLKSRGFYPWLDKEFLLPGADWESAIKRNLMESDFLVNCLSDKSICKRGFVQKEIRMALDVAQELPFGSIFLIPIRLDQCELPIQLSKFHYVDWEGDDGPGRVFQAINTEWNSSRVKSD